MRTPTFQHMPSSTPFWSVVAIATAFVVAGLASAHHMESAGHWVTGMNNRVVWGVPHVFAVFLIVSASGALNAASIASVFGRETYKPLSRLSALMAITLLVGGLTVLVLDLGRPDRLIVAMTHYNFRSIFAWNIFLYTGFIVLVVVYLWMMFEPRMNRFVGRVGTTAFAWRLMLTTGTGSIFAFLAAREAFDSAVLAPMFIAMSLSFGTALTLILSALIFSIRGDGLPTELMLNLRRLLAYFIIAVAFFVVVDHLTRLYGAEHYSVERFILLEGGIYSMLFWIGQILLGTILPAVMLMQRRCSTLVPTIVAASLVLVGAFCQLYVLIIGGQVFPIDIVPGFTETSGFFDGVTAEYHPSLAEFGLGMGGVGLALLTYLIGARVLAFLPTAAFDSGPSS